MIVDEYQDVNLAQYRLLRLLSAKVTDLTAIGDPHQAIYGFRGATPAYFLQFKEDYPRGKVIRLVRNYRSTENVLCASVEMLSKGIDRDRIPSLVPTEPAGARVHVSELATEKAEAIFIAQTIERLMGGTDSLSFYADKVAGDEGSVCGSFGDIAILFRLKALASGIEEALAYQGIPCQSVGQGDRMRGPQGRTANRHRAASRRRQQRNHRLARNAKEMYGEDQIHGDHHQRLQHRANRHRDERKPDRTLPAIIDDLADDCENDDRKWCNHDVDQADHSAWDFVAWKLGSLDA